MNGLIQSLLLLVVIFPPIAFGTIDLSAVTLMELVIFTAALLWLAKSTLQGKLILVKTALNIPILLFLLLIIIQYIIGNITSSRAGTIYPYATKVYFFEILSYMTVFLVIINNIHSKRQVNRISFAMISIGSILAIYGIIQKLTGVQKVFWFRSAREVLLFYSSYFNCNYFAGYINMIIFLTIGAFFSYLSYLDKKRGYYKFDIFECWNILFIFSIAMMITSLFHTFSQGGIITFFITSVLFYYLCSKKGLARKWVSILILALTVIVTAAILIWIRKRIVSDIISEMSRILREINTYGSRIPLWAGAMRLVKINPLFGIGLGTFKYIFPMYRPSIGISISHAHNDYLELLVETGFTGFLIFIAGMLLFFKQYMKVLNSRHSIYARSIGYGCLASSFAIFFYSFIDSNMHIGANALVFSSLLAVSFVVIHNRFFVEGEERFLFKTVSIAINNNLKKISFFIVLLIVFTYIVSTIFSIGFADIYASIGKKDKNIEYVNKAITLEPSSSGYRYLHAEILSDGFRKFRTSDRSVIKPIIDDLEEAIRLNPKFGDYHQKLGLAYLRTGHEAKAKLELKMAQELDPTAAFNYLLLAVYHFNEATKMKGINPYGAKAMEEGVSEYRKSLSIAPQFTIDRYKSLLTDYVRIKKALKLYSL